MGKPVTLLQGLFGHAMSFGADYIQVENIDGHEWVFTTIDGEKADREVPDFRKLFG